MTQDEEIALLKSKLAAYEAAPPQVVETTGVPIPVLDPRELKLDLGCGQTPREGYTGVDKFAKQDGIQNVDLFRFPWPWADNSVDALFCSHFIEHIPMANWIEVTAEEPGRHDLIEGTDLLIRFFNECYRILKPGAPFELVWPALKSTRAFMDPTHRRFIPMETLSLYLSRDWRQVNKLDHYLGATCNLVPKNGQYTFAEKDPTGQPNSIKTDLVKAKQYVEDWDYMQDCLVTLEKQP